MKLRAFHGNGLKPAVLKRALVREMEKHRRQDQIIKGTYGKMNGEWKGCAVGCSIHSLNALQGKDRETSKHSVFEEIGIPQSLAHLQDQIFESLPIGKNSRFAVDFWKAIRPGVDLSKVTAKFLVWTLLDKKHGAIRQAPADKFKDCHDAILACALLWQNYLKIGKFDESAAWSAESAASAVRSAAWSAARSDFWKAASVTLLKLLAKA